MDIFFVISGFLISSIILESLDKGFFSFREFYSRRIRRIFPALILVMAASYVLGWFVLFADEYKQLGQHIAASAGFVSNFFFWQEAGYFDNVSDTKPMLHLWSLGIEEQFYIVWPLILYAAWRIKASVLSICIAIAVISFALNISQVSGNAVAAFYSPATRFWELLAGSLLAYISLRKTTFANARVQCGDEHTVPAEKSGYGMLQNVQATTGVVLIGAAVLLLDKQDLFPGWWALLPTTGAYLIISAGSSAWFNRKVLSHRVLVWFGLISFPLYLWHWPLLSFARIIGSETPPLTIRVAAVLISVILAWLTYKLLEKPLRSRGNGRTKALALCLLMVVVGVTGYITYKRNGLNFRLKGFESSLHGIKYVLESTESCKSAIPVKSRYCLISDPGKPPTIALIGDSHSNRLYAPLAWRYHDRGENLLQLGGGGCVPFWNIETGSNGVTNNCAEQMRPLLDYVLASKHIKSVILMNRGPAFIEGIDLSSKNKMVIKKLGSDESDSKIIYGNALQETIKKFVLADKEVILMIDVPEFDYDPLSCIDAVRPMSGLFKDSPECKLPKPDVDKRNLAYIEITRSAAKSSGNIKVVDLQAPLCDQDYCYGIKDGSLLYKDPDHLNPAGAEYVVKRIWEKMQ